MLLLRAAEGHWLFERLDASLDGVLDHGEWLQYLRGMQPGVNTSSPSFLQAVAYLDPDGDGLTSLAEFQAARLPDPRRHNPGPKQIHIGLTNTATEMQVMWVTSP
jgi:hypothetical protein